MNLKPLSFNSLKTVPLAERKAEADGEDFGAPYRPGGSFSDFLCSLPGLGAAGELLELRDAIVARRRRNKGILMACGGHVMASGLNPLLVRLLEQRVISGLVLSGAALIQDVEIALSGRTIRYRDRDLHNGLYCVTEETGKLINEAINFGAIEGWGIGRSVGEKLIDAEPSHLDHSVLATANRCDIPVTVHPIIGADTFNLHPATHGESLGAAGFLDFRLLAAMLAESSGGIILTAATTVLLPRVLLQAAEAARNLDHRVEKLTCIVTGTSAGARSDVVERLVQPDGRWTRLSGADEILLPLLFAAVLDALGDGIA